MRSTVVDVLKPALALVIGSDLDAFGEEGAGTFIHLDVNIAAMRHLEAVLVVPLVETELIVVLRVAEEEECQQGRQEDEDALMHGGSGRGRG